LGSELETLFKIQGLDADLLLKQREIDEFEARLSTRRKEMEACQARIDSLTAKRKDLVNQRALADRRVTDNQELLKERRQRLSRVRTERELRAGEGEVTSLRDEIDDLEEQLLLLMGQVEEVEGQIAAERKALQDLQDADHRQVAEEAARIDALKAELMSERASRDEVAAALDERLRKQYEIVLAKRGGIAVVQVSTAGTCGGCHMQIPPQTVIEILRSGVVRACPSCQRILFASDAS